jgi:hypothetical protein
VNVPELDVELVLKVFDLREMVFRKRLFACFRENLFATMKLVPIIAKDLPPVSAFCGQL